MIKFISTIKKIINEFKIAFAVLITTWGDIKAAHLLRKERFPKTEQEEELQSTINKILDENKEAQEYWMNTIDGEWQW